MTAAFEIRRGFKTLKAGMKALLVGPWDCLPGSITPSNTAAGTYRSGFSWTPLPIFHSAVDAAVTVSYSGADIFDIGLNFNFPFAGGNRQ
jgi:hypothetical protein